MVAFSFRMGEGFAGDVNRTHPASIEPDENDATNPLTFYGQAALYTATGTVRTPLATDSSATAIAGVAVRPFPVQQSTASLANAQANIGAAGIGTANAIDLLKSGYIMVSVVGTSAKGGTVYVWVAASTGVHVQGGFEAATSAGNTITLDAKSYFNSPPDAAGVAELAFNL